MPDAPPPTDSTSTRDVMALVFGILAFNGCPLIGAIVAILLAQGSRSGVARAGSILGWINLALTAVALVAGVALLLVAAVAGQF